jgi:hypothetical protein
MLIETNKHKKCHGIILLISGEITEPGAMSTPGMREIHACMRDFHA